MSKLKDGVLEMGNSHKHHYVPVFLLEKFTDSDGFFYVYDKVTKRIGHKKRSPSSIFFEKDRNTIDVMGTPTDYLEQMYSALDTEIAIALTRVLKSKKPTPEEVVSLMLLATQLKWRTPKSDEEFNILKEETTDEDLAIHISVKDEHNTENIQAMLDHLHSSPLFKEAKRVLLPMLPLLNSDTLMDVHNHSMIYTNDKFNGIIGDCPVLEAPNSNYRNLEHFILPLSSSDTFIYKKGAVTGVTNPVFCYQRDLAILHNSIQYVACKSKATLELLVMAYTAIEQEGMADQLNTQLFNFIV